MVAVASLLAIACATPVERRALVVHTVIEEVTETVDSTTTIWVKPTAGAHANYQLPTSKHQHHHHSHKPKPVTPTTISTPSVAPLPTTPTTTSTNSSTSVPVPVYTPPVVPTTPVVVPTTPVYTPPVPTTPTYTPPVVPETTPAPVTTPEPTTQAPVPVPTTASSSGPSGGACGDVGGECSGDITYYQAGLGACGWTNDGSSEDVFALAHGMMGDQSNGNPFCGRMAQIKVPGKPVVSAKLVDKCMGCKNQSIDLSNHLFDQLAPEAEGRLHNIEWWFTS
ncbi:MAG: hypothetical protein Q9195_004044 [Heterodermia aff. obscurata]